MRAAMSSTRAPPPYLSCGWKAHSVAENHDVLSNKGTWLVVGTKTLSITTWGSVEVWVYDFATQQWSFELGNEEYNQDFFEQVQAMEARATAIGMAGQFHYIFPDVNNSVPNVSDAAALNSLGLGKRVVVDTHHWFGTGLALPLTSPDPTTRPGRV